MEYCDTLHPSRYRLYFSDNVVKPGTDSFPAGRLHPSQKGDAGMRSGRRHRFAGPAAAESLPGAERVLR